MEYYDLREDEVPLYKGIVKFKNREDDINLILTNYNLVFIEKLDLEENKIERLIFPIIEVKKYKEKYQIIKKDNDVEIYFLHNEIEFSFKKGSECRKFMSVILELLTSKNKFERAVDKVNVERQYVDKTFNIDSVGMIKKSVNNTAEGKGIFSKAFGAIKHIGFGKKKEK